MARGSARMMAWALVGAGGLYFLAQGGVVGKTAADAGLVVAALAVLFHLTQTVDPAWLVSFGIASTMFAGNWDKLGLNSSVGPHRVLLVAGMAAVVLRAPPARRRPPLRFGIVHFALAAALGYALVSAIVAGTLGEGNAQFVMLDQFGLLPFALFTVAPAAFASHRQRMILMGTLVTVGAYLGVTALIEKLKLYGLLVPGYIGDPNVGLHFGRARGPFVESDADGLALFTCAVAGAIALGLWRGRWARRLAIAAMVLGPLGALLSFSRAVWIGAVAGTLVALASTPALRRFLLPAVAAGTLGVAAAFAFVPGVASEAKERLNAKSPVWDRRNTTAAGLRMVADRPFFGFGFDRSFEELTLYFRMPPDIPLTGAHAGLHNIYLAYAVNLGLIGFGLWALALMLALGGALAARAPPPIAPWKAGLKGALIAWAIVGLFSPAHYPFASALVWTWAGLVYGRRAEAPVRIPSALFGSGRLPYAGEARTLPS